MENSQLNQSWWSLRITYGLVAFLAGLDKFFHVLTNWDNLPVSRGGFACSGKRFHADACRGHR